MEMFMSSAETIAWPRPTRIVWVGATPCSASMEMEATETVVPIIVCGLENW